MILFLLGLVAGACIGALTMAAARSAADGDTAADRAIRDRVAANRAARSNRIWSAIPPAPDTDEPDEHETNLGAA